MFDPSTLRLAGASDLAEDDARALLFAKDFSLVVSKLFEIVIPFDYLSFAACLNLEWVYSSGDVWKEAEVVTQPSKLLFRV